jgi:hypothetical protein
VLFRLGNEIGFAALHQPVAFTAKLQALSDLRHSGAHCKSGRVWVVTPGSYSAFSFLRSCWFSGVDVSDYPPRVIFR